MNMNEEKVFGHTMAEVTQIHKEVLDWVDINHPYVQTKDDKEDSFRIAFREGSVMLRKNEPTRVIFSKVLKKRGK